MQLPEPIISGDSHGDYPFFQQTSSKESGEKTPSAVTAATPDPALAPLAELEQQVHSLYDRLEAFPKGSPEYQSTIEQLDLLIFGVERGGTCEPRETANPTE